MYQGQRKRKGCKDFGSVNYVDMSCNVFTSYLIIVYSCAVYCVVLCISYVDYDYT